MKLKFNQVMYMILAFILMGEVIRDALDPKARALR